ncbi:beta-lactamase family protein (plasmid) [Embleya sp. NBC_00888]|uniref:serine hydrolase domain-containing protein n=1 Tax=Embleya sp. NBC_00888 TaxID=2975960 RepID=UPI002F913C28|nr:beta-lactamase family protein [Embleya sp. NBC_00888]
MTSTRRRMLGVLGAAPLAAGTVLGAEGTARGDARADRDTRSPGPIPEGLGPGGELDRFVADLAARDAFSGTLLITRRGRTVLSRAYGMADRRRDVPITPDTLFALASVTKLFTAVAVAQLVQRGRLSYASTVGTYLDGLPAEIADHVTLHHLLTHTSGLGNHQQAPGFEETAATWTTADQVMDGTLDFIRRMPLSFPPGAADRYSNSGYHLLGTIVARVSGRSWFDYARERIFRPAGMADTDFVTAPRWRRDPGIAHPYVKQPSGERVDDVAGRVFIGTPAGDAFSTTSDMDRFARALLRDKLLAPPFTRTLLGGKLPLGPPTSGPPPKDASPTGPSPTGPADPPPGGGDPRPQATFQCYGPIGVVLADRWTFGHGGGAPGESTGIEMFPDGEWVIVVLGNYDQDTVRPVVGMARRLVAVAG